MRVGIVGAGRIGGNCARQFAKGGHRVKLSFSRDPSRPEALAAEIGDRASVGTPREATEFGEVVVFSVLWDSIDAALGDDRVVQWICGDDGEAKRVVAGLITDAGYVPVDLGGMADCAVMEAPRRLGAVYGEEYRLADAAKVLDAIKAGRKIPPTPSYG
jgi:predicted dinucleotide-binding enzyme